jgi:XTP/dITP diphosphohydrolase
MPRTDFLVATGNPGKLREFRDMLGSDRYRWRSLSDFPDIEPVPETGLTFRANAILKATGYALATRAWAMADDSGLEVDALAGNPGVFSARWAESHDAGQGDAANNALLLKQLEGIPDEKRTARFVCVLAVADPNGRIVLTMRDVFEGSILHAPVGANGFGYDPLFRVAGMDRTSAELPADEKHRISHRGKALRRLNVLMNRFSPGWV